MRTHSVLYQIKTGDACFGIVSRNGIVVEAAPHARGQIGRETELVLVDYLAGNAEVCIVSVEKHEADNLTQDEQDWLAESIWNEDNSDWVEAATVGDEEIFIRTTDGRQVTYTRVLEKGESIG